ncbi:retrovirus-related pol polyprotein from transposon TNT 1-94 [Tanacetum coccineum]
MDVNPAFLNGNLEEEVYVEQSEGFFINGKEKMVCKLKKSIYGLKQASRQWYSKFHDTITSFGFEEIIVDRWLGVIDAVSKPMKMNCDNTATIFFYKNDKYFKGTDIKKITKPSTGSERAQDYESNGALGFYWASP